MQTVKRASLMLAVVLALPLGVIAGSSQARAYDQRDGPDTYITGPDGRDYRQYPRPLGRGGFYDLDHFWNQQN
jgi:hypothetical protein